jgi:hypothetical protein
MPEDEAAELEEAVCDIMRLRILFNVKLGANCERLP